MTGNQSLDPQFAGTFDFSLLPTSPLIDAGIHRVSASLPSTDLDGRPRIAASAIDMGAYEFPMVFRDDFEAGTLDAWSATAP